MNTLENFSEFVELVIKSSDDSIEKAKNMINFFDPSIIESFLLFISAFKEFSYLKIGEIYIENRKRDDFIYKDLIKSSFSKYLYLKYPDFIKIRGNIGLKEYETIDYFENPIKSNKLAQIIQNDDINNFVSFCSTENINLSKHSINIIEMHFNVDQFACVCGSLNILKYLVINQISSNEIASTAIMGGNEEIIEFLVNQSVSFDGTLMIALWIHQNKLAKWIYENYKNDDFSLPVCIFYYNYEMLFYFLANGFDINTQDLQKKTCLHYATIQSNSLVIQYLIEHGINKNIEDLSHNKAISYCQSEEIGKLLV